MLFALSVEFTSYFEVGQGQYWTERHIKTSNSEVKVKLVKCMQAHHAFILYLTKPYDSQSRYRRESSLSEQGISTLPVISSVEGCVLCVCAIWTVARKLVVLCITPMA